MVLVKSFCLRVAISISPSYKINFVVFITSVLCGLIGSSVYYIAQL